MGEERMDKTIEKNIEIMENKTIQAMGNTMYIQNYNPDNGDYIGDDGIVICGNCGQPRGYSGKPFLEAFGHDYIVLVPDRCQCQKEKLAAEQKARAEAEIKTEREDRRKKGLKSDAYRQMRLGNTDIAKGNAAQIKTGIQYSQMLKNNRTNKGLIFTGTCGTGKTHVAACIANELIDNGKTVYMDIASSMVKSATDFKTRTEFMETLASADLVVIDDFGTERSTANADEKIFEIIDERVRSKKPMVITTNLSVAELKNPVDIQKQRLYSRILGVCAIVSFSGNDIRLAHEMEQTKVELQELFQ